MAPANYFVRFITPEEYIPSKVIVDSIVQLRVHGKEVQHSRQTRNFTHRKW